MRAEDRLMIIELAEGFAEDMRRGRYRFGEGQGRHLARFLREMLQPESNNGCVAEDMCSIAMACHYLGISQPTFRKYVREGKIAAGRKMMGVTELMWEKKEIEAFGEWYFTKGRKEIKD